MTPFPPPLRRAWIFFSVWLLVCAALFARPLTQLLQFATQNDDASHILLVPVISAWLLFLKRDYLTAANPLDRGAAWLVALAAIAAAAARTDWAGEQNIRLTLYATAFLSLAVSGFVAIFGRQSTRPSSFALLFLIFAIPLPSKLVDRIVVQLQAGSAAVAGIIFDICQVPALREGFVFRMPRISIEVAAECSGIRSSMALLILAVLVAHFSFRPFWKKALFVAAGLLVMIVKNGARIATLTILANYVDPDFLYGRLHRQGGVVFFLLGCALLLPVYWMLRRNEPRPGQAEVKS
ncbi:MAG TPA: exosortase/archaeosortase family protein [Methylomirabilota bacterium]|nr:exosortase/archaeosortase family protein [Methylomirabilota bacterium]